VFIALKAPQKEGEAKYDRLAELNIARFHGLWTGARMQIWQCSRGSTYQVLRGDNRHSAWNSGATPMAMERSRLYWKIYPTC